MFGPPGCMGCNCSTVSVEKRSPKLASAKALCRNELEDVMPCCGAVYWKHQSLSDELETRRNVFYKYQQVKEASKSIIQWYEFVVWSGDGLQITFLWRLYKIPATKQELTKIQLFLG